MKPIYSDNVKVIGVVVGVVQTSIKESRMKAEGRIPPAAE